MTRKMSAADRLLLLGASFLAAYQVVAGIEGLPAFAVAAYTVAFGVLLVAGLLIMILGFEFLDSPAVVILATVVPTSLSVGLVAEYLPMLSPAYLFLAAAGFLAVVLTRLSRPGLAATLTLSLVHGISGLMIFGLPLYLSLSGQAEASLALISLGGALIGLGGILLSFLKAGRPLLSRSTILAILPTLLLLTTAAFVAGFYWK